jgi:putative transposase
MSRETSRGTATVRQMCGAFGLSRQAYYAAQREPEVRALRPRAERRGPWATAEELEAGIRRVVAANPGWGVRKVWASLRREGLVASRKRVWAMMRRLGLVFAPCWEHEEGRVRRGHVTVPDSNRRWASDLTTVWTRQEGVVGVTIVVDCGDRSLLDVEVSKSQESVAVLRPLQRALRAEFGVPAYVPHDLELRTDHGTQYTGGDCFLLCRTWKVNHTFAPVGRPTGNAVAERLIQTLKVELIWTRDWESLHELRQAIETWAVVYNCARPHQALAWATPSERRCANLGIEIAEAGSA